MKLNINFTEIGVRDSKISISQGLIGTFYR